MLPKVSLLLLSVDSPIKAGIYKDGILAKSYEKHGKVGDALPAIFAEVFRDYEPCELYYLRGPGSFTAIKLSYIFLKTISIAREIPLFGAPSFVMNANKPIRAYGDFYFINHAGEITLKKLNEENQDTILDIETASIKNQNQATNSKESKQRIAEFSLPQNLDSSLFSNEIEPLYILPPL